MREKGQPRVSTTIRLTEAMAAAISAEADRTGDTQNEVMVAAIDRYLSSDIKLASDEADFLKIYRWMSWNTNATVLALWRDMRKTIVTLYDTMNAALEAQDDPTPRRDAGRPLSDRGAADKAKSGDTTPTKGYRGALRQPIKPV